MSLKNYKFLLSIIIKDLFTFVNKNNGDKWKWVYILSVLKFFYAIKCVIILYLISIWCKIKRNTWTWILTNLSIRLYYILIF